MIGAPLKSRGTTKGCCPCSGSGSISVAKLDVEERRDSVCVLYLECNREEKMESTVLVAAEDAMDFVSYETSPRDAFQRVDSISICSWSESIPFAVLVAVVMAVDELM